MRAVETRKALPIRLTAICSRSWNLLSFMRDTPDQLKATTDVKRDMEEDEPMDRLICGDVGFGKTEIAIRAAFKAVADNKQVAVLVPTTVLAFQHFRRLPNDSKTFRAVSIILAVRGQSRMHIP